MQCPRCRKHIDYPTQRQLQAWLYRYGYKMLWKEVARKMDITPVSAMALMQRLRKVWPDVAPKRMKIKVKYSFEENRDSEPKIKY